jgi:hypothetical protein
MPGRPRRNRVREMWQTYQRTVLPANAPPVYVQECRKAFYAGASVVFGLHLSMADSMSDEEAMTMLADLTEELEEFPRLVMEGRR